MASCFLMRRLVPREGRSDARFHVLTLPDGWIEPCSSRRRDDVGESLSSIKSRVGGLRQNWPHGATLSLAYHH